jgi:pimeloyl-ACP methyl ester carboxylesterase
MASLLPHAEAVCIPRSGHWPFLENPLVFEHALRSFLCDGDPATLH